MLTIGRAYNISDHTIKLKNTLTSRHNISKIVFFSGPVDYIRGE